MKYLIEIEYKGKLYKGWQKQPNERTVQETIEKILKIILRKEIEIYGASRTDKGVHAKQQFAHFESEEKLNKEKIMHSLNSMLKNEEIVIKSLKEVDAKFHARHSCIEKTYKYQIFVNLKKDVFLEDRSFRIKKFDIKKANECAKFLIGTHDFSSFKGPSCQSITQIRSINEITFKEENELIIATIKGKSFLQHQIRIIIGTIIEIIKKEEPASKMQEILQAKNRTKAGPSAPPHGLFLEKIIYE